jgi:glycosyltransferase involved in cell wall biosynthesis
MMTEPLVSVIIPTYNRAEYLTESIDSVLAQNFKEFELIVFDDGSTDNTQEVLATYGEKIIVLSDINRGCAAARNRSVEAARGKLIAFHDTDDLMLEGRLEKQYKFMIEHPEATAVTGNIIVQGQEKINYLEKCGVDFSDKGWVIFEKPFQKLLSRNFMSNPSTMVWREKFLEVGGIDESLVIASDWDLWLRMARKWPLACINVPCTWLRKHEGNISSRPQAYEHRMRIIDMHLRCGEEINEEILKKIHKRLFKINQKYIKLNYLKEIEPDWRRKARYYAKHLKWYQRMLVAMTTAIPQSMGAFLLRKWWRLRGYKTLPKAYKGIEIT